MAKFSDADLAKLAEVRLKHPDAELREARGCVVILRPADEGEFDRYASESLSKDPNVKTGAFRNLFRATCLHPEPAEIAAMLKRRPGLALTFGKEAADISGLIADEQVGKA